MKLIDTVNAFVAEDGKPDRAIFETSMKARIEKDGYQLVDLLYEVYQCQRDIGRLCVLVDTLLAETAQKSKKKA